MALHLRGELLVPFGCRRCRCKWREAVRQGHRPVVSGVDVFTAILVARAHAPQRRLLNWTDALLDPALKWCMRGLKIVQTEKPSGVVNEAEVNFISLGLGLLVGSNNEGKTDQSKSHAKKSAAPVGGAPLDGGHAERATSRVGTVSNTKRRKPLMRRTRRMQRHCWKGFCEEAESVHEIARDEFVMGHAAEFRFRLAFKEGK